VLCEDASTVPHSTDAGQSGEGAVTQTTSRRAESVAFAQDAYATLTGGIGLCTAT